MNYTHVFNVIHLPNDLINVKITTRVRGTGIVGPRGFLVLGVLLQIGGNRLVDELRISTCATEYVLYHYVTWSTKAMHTFLWNFTFFSSLM